MENEKDQLLWEIAGRRASFKYHLIIYFVVTGFLWAIWLFTGAPSNNGRPWPIWPSLGWGLGLAFHYMGAYVFPQKNDVEREYRKLKDERK